MERPKIFDVRVHLLPPAIAQLIFNAYKRDAWPVQYQLMADEVLSFLKRAGVSRVAGICYTSMQGMAPFLNDFMAELWERHRDMLVPFGTVYPGEDGCAQEVTRVLDELGFAGIKLHCHLLKMAPHDAALAPVFEAVAQSGKVLNIHSGTVSRNNGALEEVRRYCNVGNFRKAMQRTPHAKVIVPHIGYDEVQEYIDLMDEFPNLYFDTAMAIGGHRVAIGEPLPDVRPLELKTFAPGTHPHLPLPWKPALEQLVPQIMARPHRFLYGSDFPHLPYQWNFEVEQLARYLPQQVLDRVLWTNAAELFGDAAAQEAGAGEPVQEGAQVS